MSERDERVARTGRDMSRPQNPVRHLPKRHDAFGEEINSEGGETPHEDQSPPHNQTVTPPPSQVAPQRRKNEVTFEEPPQVHPTNQDATPAVASSSGQSNETPKSRIPQHRKRGKFSRRNIALANGRSKNRLFALVHPLHLAVIFFAVIAIAVMIGALATTYWYVVTSGTIFLRVGLFTQCDGNGNCQSIQFSDRVSTVCTRSGSDLQRVNNTVIGLGIAALVVSALSVVTAAISRCVATPITSILTTVFALLSAIGYSASIGTFAYNKEHWEFCGESFCQFIQQLDGSSTGCDASYGYSLGLAAIAVGGSFLSLLFAIFRVVFREWNIVEEDTAPAISNEELAPQNRPRAAVAPQIAREPYAQAEVSDAEQPDPKYDIPPPPDGDWVYDSECGMYWSESEFLFLDPYTQHSYDPNSDMWYDPDADEWYQGEQIEATQEQH